MQFGCDSFVTKVLQWARQNETLKVEDDQISNPTWASMLAEITTLILGRGVRYIGERKGLYHLAGDGLASRLEWAREILTFDPNLHEQTAKGILPRTTTDFPTPAVRPLFSALECGKFTTHFDLCLPDWEESLSLAMAAF